MRANTSSIKSSPSIQQPERKPNAKIWRDRGYRFDAFHLIKGSRLHNVVTIGPHDLESCSSTTIGAQHCILQRGCWHSSPRLENTLKQYADPPDQLQINRWRYDTRNNTIALCIGNNDQPSVAT